MNRGNGRYTQVFTDRWLYWDPNHTYPVNYIGVHKGVPWDNHTFSDVVPHEHPHFRSVEIVAAWGLMSGDSNGKFRPNSSFTRGEFADVCYKLKGSPSFTPPKTSPFKDVPTSHPYYKEICWVKSAGIANGWANGTYEPQSAVLRDAVAAMLYRMAPANAYTFTVPSDLGFSDVPKSNMFRKEIEFMRSTGISAGWPHPDNHHWEDYRFIYKPLNIATRADVATFALRWDDLFGTYGRSQIDY